ncbi:MAG: hypothetical protein O2840_00340 [bacterium]|nr:hypothetical protein [bacterium]
MLSELISLLSYLGITAQSVVPIGIVGFFLWWSLSKKLAQVEDRTADIEKSVVEIQGILTNKYRLKFQQSIASKYGKSNSPIVLKSTFKPFITKPKLDKQIETKKPQLLEWLEDQEPQTGLDAQDAISALVLSDEIDHFLDLKSYKQYLYEQGKTSEDAQGILILYLFEVLIPELKISKA